MRTVIFIFIFAALLASFARADQTNYFSDSGLNAAINKFHYDVHATTDAKLRVRLLQKLQQDVFNYMQAKDLSHSQDFTAMNTFESGLFDLDFTTLDMNSCKRNQYVLMSSNKGGTASELQSRMSQDIGTRLPFEILDWLCLNR